MERVIKKNDFGDIACNDTIIYSRSNSEIGRGLVGFYDDWIIIEQKYYKYLEDDCIIEIWYDSTGIIIDPGLNKYLKVGTIGNYFIDYTRVELTYKEAMNILEAKQDDNLEHKINKYSIGDMVIYKKKEKKIKSFKFDRQVQCYVYVFEGHSDKIKEDELNPLLQNCFKDKEPMFYNKKANKPIGWEKLNYQLDIKKTIKESKGNICCEIEVPTVKQNNNGGATDYYTLPEDANTLQDLIEHRNMNGSVKDIFKACYRLGIKTEDELRDLNKMAYYSLREVGRITGRKDYITIAKELIGSQAVEKE